MKSIRIAALVLLLQPGLADAVSISTLDTPVTLDFTGFTGSGFQPVPAPGQLDSDDFVVHGLSDDSSPSFGDTLTSGDFARGGPIEAGEALFGGVYAERGQKGVSPERGKGKGSVP